MKFCAIVASLVFPVALAAQARHAFTFEDMMALKRINEPVPSPDGRWVLFSAVEVNLAENTKRPHLWVAPLNGSGGPARQLTSDAAGEDRPRWSPDGRQFAYISSKSGSGQVWIADFDSGTGEMANPRQLTNISSEADGELWSPDGANILFVSAVYPECSVPAGESSSPEQPAVQQPAARPALKAAAFSGAGRDPAEEDRCNQQKDADRASSKVKATIFTRLFYRHWSTYYLGKRSHLFVVPSSGGPETMAHDLTPGDHDVPTFSLGGQDLYAFSPDGKEVCFTSNVDEVEATSTNNDLFLVPVTGGPARKITSNPASDSTPLYSPDGRYIAYRAQFRPGYESDRFRLLLYERSTGKITNLTERFDEWVGSYVWSPDSRALYFSAEHKGHALIYTIPAAPPFHVRVIVGGHNDDLGITADGKRLLFTRMSAQAPNEIYSADAAAQGCPADRGNVNPGAGPNCRLEPGDPLTQLNRDLLSQVAMQPIESFFFTGSQNASVEGFMVKPPDFNPQQKYPLKFLIHGGPQGAWGDSWSFRWNPELFAANGYVVIMINPRGSTGYGQKFIDDINGDWGGRAYEDLMLGLDYAEKTYRFVDRNRECALGASFGGYMAYWLEGHTTRFQCIVAHDGMFNTESAYGTTEELWFNEWEFKGSPWNNRELYRKWSPHLSATSFKTPLLVVHGQLDYRLDVSEGFQAFTTLQRLKVPSKMLYFPDEGHWVLKPQNSQLWYKTVNDWVDQWVKR
ncbi:MAG: S9 family peptidase [Acidobacteria bacterium]|nr:S9 family peptidase [Acidobacteriota bacterium]